MLRQGRPVKLNRKLLKTGKKDYASIVFFGDWHYGHPTCLIDEATKMLDYCLEKHIYVILMGDLLECGITGSIGDSVYAQKLEPQRQMEDVVEYLRSLADAGLILGLHSGNHEDRIYKSSGVNIAKIMAGTLRVPFLSSACWHLLNVGDMKYSIYTLHGASGSRFVYTKLKAITDISHYFDCDAVFMAHVHDLASIAIERQYINMRNKTIAYKKQYLTITGHYLGYQLSYAQMKGFPPSKIGSPKAQFFGKKKDIHISF